VLIGDILSPGSTGFIRSLSFTENTDILSSAGSGAVIAWAVTVTNAPHAAGLIASPPGV
jgi:hypothetical protein